MIPLPPPFRLLFITRVEVVEMGWDGRQGEGEGKGGDGKKRRGRDGGAFDSASIEKGGKRASVGPSSS